jgi:hypothetical protein
MATRDGSAKSRQNRSRHTRHGRRIESPNPRSSSTFYSGASSLGSDCGSHTPSSRASLVASRVLVGGVVAEDDLEAEDGMATTTTIHHHHTILDRRDRPTPSHGQLHARLRRREVPNPGVLASGLELQLAQLRGTQPQTVAIETRQHSKSRGILDGIRILATQTRIQDRAGSAATTLGRDHRARLDRPARIHRPNLQAVHDMTAQGSVPRAGGEANACARNTCLPELELSIEPTSHKEADLPVAGTGCPNVCKPVMHFGHPKLIPVIAQSKPLYPFSAAARKC